MMPVVYGLHIHISTRSFWAVATCREPDVKFPSLTPGNPNSNPTIEAKPEHNTNRNVNSIMLLCSS